MPTPEHSSDPKGCDCDFLPPRRTLMLVAGNLLLAALLAAALIRLTLGAPDPSAPVAAPAAVVASTAASSAGSPPPRLPAQQSRQALFDTLLTMLVAGGAGGTLCNLRGLFRWMSINKGRFPKAYALPFVVRPFTGSLTGLFVFFVGNLLVAALAETRPRAWETLDGRLPYIGFALLAGFAAQEFMEKLKEVARTTFGGTEDSDDDESEERGGSKKGEQPKAP